MDPFLFSIQFCEQIIDLRIVISLHLGPSLMRVVALDMVQIAFVVIIAHLAVGVGRVRHRLLDRRIMHGFHVYVRFAMFTQLTLVLLFSLNFYLLEFFEGKSLFTLRQ